MSIKIHRGFTLIELMVVIAIVGILAGIAYPSFSDSMMKSRRTDAKTAMLSIVLSQSKLRGSCRTYAGTIGAANNCANSTVKGLSASENGYYTIALSGNTGNAYVLTATAQGAQTKDTACTPLTLTINATYPNGNKLPSSCW